MLTLPRKTFRAIALTTSVWLGITALPLQAQTVSNTQLQTDLQQAVCQNDWNGALEVIDPLIGSSQTTPAYRSQLVTFRRQVETWRDTQATFSNVPNCPSASAVANSTPTTPSLRRRFDWSRGIMAFPELLDMPVGIARTDECLMLAGLLSQTGTEAQTLSASATPGDPAPFVQLIGLVDRTSATMQRLRITDGRLQGIKQRFISTYSTMGDASRNLVDAANEQDFASAESAYEAIITAAGQEQQLIEETVAYCNQR